MGFLLFGCFFVRENSFRVDIELRARECFAGQDLTSRHLDTSQEMIIATEPISIYMTAYMVRSITISSNITQYESKKAIANDIGIHHSFLISFPIHKPIVADDIGFIMKKKAIINPIASCGSDKFKNSMGNISKMIISAIIVMIILFFSFKIPASSK